MSEQNGDELGRRIRTARVSAGLTRHELADLLGVSFNTIERSENGRRRVSEDELVRIGEACCVPERFMLHGWAACSEGHKIDQLRETVEQMSEAILARTRYD